MGLGKEKGDDDGGVLEGSSGRQARAGGAGSRRRVLVQMEAMGWNIDVRC